MTLYFFDLIPNPISLLLYVLRLLIVHLHVFLLLNLAFILFFKEAFDLSQLCAVNDALLNLSLFLFDLELLQKERHFDLLVL